MDDKLLLDIGQRLGHDWLSLASSLNEKEIVDAIITNRTISPAIQCLRMLQTWIASGNGVTLDKLCKCLRKCFRTDLAESCVEWACGSEITNGLISKLSERITCCWEALGIYLGIPLFQINTIKMSQTQSHTCPGVDFLEKWRMKTGCDNEGANCKKLITALQHIKRLDLVVMLHTRT